MHDIIILISYMIIFIEPENVTAVESVTYISVSWSPVESPYCGGVLYYVCSLIHQNTTIKITTNRYFCEFNELNASTTYYISIAAVNRAVIGEATFIYATTDCKLFYTYHCIKLLTHNKQLNSITKQILQLFNSMYACTGYIFLKISLIMCIYVITLPSVVTLC